MKGWGEAPSRHPHSTTGARQDTPPSYPLPLEVPRVSRLDDLNKLREDTLERMAGCNSDQNFAILGRLLADVLKQIDELGGGEQAAPKETGLSDFEKRLRERESGSKASRRAKGV